MNRSLAILTFGSLVTACTVTVNTNDSPRGATEGSLMQADRDFAVATHARGIDGWMSFYAPDAIRIRYRGNMVKGVEEIRKFDLPGISDTTTVLNWEPTDALTTARDLAVTTVIGNLAQATQGRTVIETFTIEDPSAPPAKYTFNSR